VAGDAKQLIIAKLLESKMVFMSQGSGPEEGKKVVMSRARHRSFYNTETLSKLRADIIHHLATDLQVKLSIRLRRILYEGRVTGYYITL
jgi:hypothetical protein